MTTAEQFKAILQELQSLYEEDKYNDVEDKASLADEELTLNHAYVLIDEIKISQSYKFGWKHALVNLVSRSLLFTSTTSS